MTRPDTWMPMYWADYWADTGSLTAAQHGAYLNLMGRYWRDGGLPTDDGALQRLSTMTEKEWKAGRAAVLRFFAVDGDRLTHKRIEAELTIARAKYQAKAEAGARGAAKRWRNQSQKDGTTNGTAIAEPLANGCTTHNSHSPIGETTANAVVARKPRTQRRTRLADDWKPSQASIDYATAGGLTREEIDRLAAEFVRYWTGPDAKNRGIKADWEGTWHNNIDRNLGRILASRPRVGQPRPNGSGAGSVVDVVARLKAKAGGNGEIQPGFRGEPEGFRTSEHDRTNQGEMPGNDSPILESDDAERMFRASRGDETDHGLPTRAGSRFGSPTGPVRAQAGGLSGGRGEEGSGHAAEHEQVVADLGGTEGPAGFVQHPPAQAASGDDGLEIPTCLRRVQA